MDSALFPFLVASCHKKAADLRRKGRELKAEHKWFEDILKVYSPHTQSLLPNLLDRCFLPARWAVSMARVSRTGRWGQIAHAKLERRGGDKQSLGSGSACTSHPFLEVLSKAQLPSIPVSITHILVIHSPPQNPDTAALLLNNKTLLVSNHRALRLDPLFALTVHPVASAPHPLGYNWPAGPRPFASAEGRGRSPGGISGIGGSGVGREMTGTK